MKIPMVITVIPMTKNMLFNERKISDGDLLNLLAFDCNVLARHSGPILSALM